MPKTLLQKKKHEKLIALIWGSAVVNGKTNADLCEIIGCTPPTVYSRRNHPENFTLSELSKLGRALNIPIEEMRQCITY